MKTLPEFDQFLQSTVLKTQFGMSGWNLEIRDTSIACQPQTFVYLYDYFRMDLDGRVVEGNVQQNHEHLRNVALSRIRNDPRCADRRYGSP